MDDVQIAADRVSEKMKKEMEKRGMALQELPSFRVIAKNFAKDSDNQIHGDEIAGRYGFRGGLVPGVGVYGYMTHPVVERLGRDWLESGWITTKFIKPVYDGETVVARAWVVAAEPLKIELKVEDLNGDLRAVGEAGMDSSSLPPKISDYPDVAAPAREFRKPARIEAWPVGAPLGKREFQFDLSLSQATFVPDMCETLPIYFNSRAPAHPAFIPAQANYITRDNIALGPWIHVASTTRHFGTIENGENVTLRGRVAAAWKKKEREFLDLDIAVFGHANRSLATIHHRAIIGL